jgi:hypothetical protein
MTFRRPHDGETTNALSGSSPNASGEAARAADGGHLMRKLLETMIRALVTTNSRERPCVPPYRIWACDTLTRCPRTDIFVSEQRTPYRMQ